MLGSCERDGRHKSEARSPFSGACDTNVFLSSAGGGNEPSHVPRAVNIGNLAHRNRPAGRPEPSRRRGQSIARVVAWLCHLVSTNDEAANWRSSKCPSAAWRLFGVSSKSFPLAAAPRWPASQDHSWV